MAEPFTYHDDGGDDLEPAEREVACRYFLDAGPQHTEFVTQFLGPSECGKFDVLWEESDWTEDVTVAVAWMRPCGPVWPRKSLRIVCTWPSRRMLRLRRAVTPRSSQCASSFSLASIRSAAPVTP